MNLKKCTEVFLKGGGGLNPENLFLNTAIHFYRPTFFLRFTAIVKFFLMFTFIVGPSFCFNTSVLA